jgi:ketosteroid isomerase-like protein
MELYDQAFVDRFLAPWNRHDVDGAMALMTDDCVWEIPRGSEPHGTLFREQPQCARRSPTLSRQFRISTTNQSAATTAKTTWWSSCW